LPGILLLIVPLLATKLGSNSSATHGRKTMRIQASVAQS
jgi:hypothetical protein